jgi:hypothetical protein
VLYTALTAWEQHHVAHHLAALRRAHEHDAHAETAVPEPAEVPAVLQNVAA